MWGQNLPHLGTPRAKCNYFLEKGVVLRELNKLIIFVLQLTYLNNFSMYNNLTNFS